jgi:hypothetical protein
MGRIDLACNAPTLHPDYRESRKRRLEVLDPAYVKIHTGCNRGVSGLQWDTRDGADVVVAAVA